MLRLIIIRLANYLRQPFWKLRHNKISNKLHITKDVFMRGCKVEDYAYIGLHCVLNNVNIGKYTSIASGVQIGGMEHAYWDLSTSCYLTDQNIEGNSTHIENDVWIGADSIIKQGITIGNGAVVGANSFVNKDVPPYAIVVGSPAKIIKYRFSEQMIARLSASQYWNCSPREARMILREIRSSFATK